MNRKAFAALIEKQFLILDGGMGTRLMELGFTEFELLNIQKPGIPERIHNSYASAGSDIILTNTYTANRLKLNHEKMGEKTMEINQAGVEIARKAAPHCLIAGDIGPLPSYLQPLGDLSFSQAYELYHEVATGLKKADLLFIETLSDIRKLKAAVLAARDATSLPIIVSMTPQGGRTSTGTDIETYAAVAEALDVDAIGLNCSEGPEELYKAAKVLLNITTKPVSIKPNAGLPRIVDGKAVFLQSPKQFASFAEKFHALGVNMLGGCCGTNDRHIKAIADILKGKSPIPRSITKRSRLCSRLRSVLIGEKTLVVGERINPTNKPEFQAELKAGKMDTVKELALAQVADGAALLDINVGIPGSDEAEILPKVVRTVQSFTDAPLVIDSSDPESMELALQQSDGKPLLNSVNGSERSLAEILPLAKRYGAAIIGLTLDHEGIPLTMEKRLTIAKRIIAEAERVGIQKEDIYIDALVMTMATNPDIQEVLLASLKEIKKLGVKTILGISNISHGLPNRSSINASFLQKAMNAGLDLAIINPKVQEVQGNAGIEIFRVEKPKTYHDLPLDEKIHQAILYGDEDTIVAFIEEALKTMDALALNDILVRAMFEVGDKFNTRVYFLPQVLASARTMKKAFSRLKPELKKNGRKQKGKVVFATVEHDVHDIGKNIVIALLESHHYTVIDLGVNVSKEKIIMAVDTYHPNILCLSALMTTTALEMEKVIKALRQRNIRIPVMVGGAVINDEYSQQIHAGYAKDALSAIKEINELIKNGHHPIHPLPGDRTAAEWR
ncbi:MAG: homocysteine S-methyltransferase family protein [Nanoarchaeota archaeon]